MCVCMSVCIYVCEYEARSEIFVWLLIESCQCSRMFGRWLCVSVAAESVKKLIS